MDELKQKVRYDVVMLFVSAAAAALAAMRTVSSMCLFGAVCSCRNREKRERESVLQRQPCLNDEHLMREGEGKGRVVAKNCLQRLISDRRVLRLLFASAAAAAAASLPGLSSLLRIRGKTVNITLTHSTHRWSQEERKRERDDIYYK